MRNSNSITLLTLTIIVMGVLVFSSYTKHYNVKTDIADNISHESNSKKEDGKSNILPNDIVDNEDNIASNDIVSINDNIANNDDNSINNNIDISDNTNSINNNIGINDNTDSINNNIVNNNSNTTNNSLTNNNSNNSNVTNNNLINNDNKLTDNDIANTDNNITNNSSTNNDNNLELASLSDALFIGDSRTVGIMEYANLNEADFFCSTGMSVFDVLKERISVPHVGKVTLSELLTNKTYGKIYVMLGINELGYDFNNIIKKYNEVINFICDNQPDSIIFIQANLHVSKKRSESDDYINNMGIDRLNSALAEFANNDTIFYIDANYLFDDEDGNLSADKTSDNAHLYGKYYLDWGKWICTETAKYIKEG